MIGKLTDAITEITANVLSAMPGWRFSEPPRGFGWATDRHLRAVLAKDCRREKVIIRKSWSTSGFEVECYLYGCVLQDLPLNTPKLWSTFHLKDCATGWMILEDVGRRCANAGCSEDRRAFLAALGSLHGRGLYLAESGRFRGSPLPRFPLQHWHYDEWGNLIMLGLESSRYALEEWIVNLLESVQRRVEIARPTLLHGDTDYSNVVLSHSGASLVDWEYACIGPASADLGRALEPVDCYDELESYHLAYQEASGVDVPFNDIVEVADIGLALNSLRWICYYLRRVNEGNDPGEDWRNNYYRPIVERLRFIRSRRPRWCMI